MKRYPPFDPPEYVDWKPEAKQLKAYLGRLQEPALRKALEELGREGLGDLYRGLLRNRLHDTTLKRWVRTGVITKAWLGTGEEAVTVGAVHALGEDDVVGPMIRNAAASFGRSTLSITSKNPTASATLLVCSGPIKRSSISLR